ncbi:hypothetical protein Ciccas_014543 [Cichlidogyrus casuarinus]|uniref:EF-hand domain-containing protein n=1 Tax=Cichlidogyrus casuarinus TaxID=1844966 RepID=A0ABD2PJ16_9PLAT
MLNGNYVRNVFRAYDEDRDGYLTKTEAVDAANEFGIEKKDIRKVVKEMNLPDENHIPVSQLTEAVKLYCVMKFKKDPFREMFRRVDLDGSGKLDFFEVKMVMGAFGMEAPDSHVRDIFDKADRNRDGLIDEHEYINFMREIRQKI